MKFKVAIGLIFISLLTGCRSVDSKSSDNKENTRYFKTISDEVNGRIIYDTRTGIEYWMSYGYSNVLTVLVDADGNPLIYDRSEEE
jgi:hypothetical protein